MPGKSLQKATKVYDWILKLTTIVSGVLIIFLTISICVDVCMRYFFKAPVTWVDEIAGFIQLYIAFLVAAWVLRRDGHVSMDVVLTRFSTKNQAIINAATSLIGAAVFFAVVWFSAMQTLYVFQMDHRTPTLMRVPMFIITAIIPFGSLLLGIEFLLKSWGFFHDWKNPECKPDEMAKQVNR
jgi:C4-dicarboxylate transporter DctQ subunit